MADTLKTAVVDGVDNGDSWTGSVLHLAHINAIRRSGTRLNIFIESGYVAVEDHPTEAAAIAALASWQQRIEDSYK